MTAGRFTKLMNQKVDVRNVRKPRFPEAVNFMRRYYGDDPLIRAMGINNQHKETHDFLSAFWLTLLRTNLSLAAMHKNKICGLCINCPLKKKEDVKMESPPKSVLQELTKFVKTDATKNLLYSWDKIERESSAQTFVSDEGKGARVLEMAGLATASEYRNMGIGKKLVESSARLATLLGFEYVKIDCTNPLTAKICNSLGWKKILDIPFDNFDGVVRDLYKVDGDDQAKVEVFIQPTKVQHQQQPES